MPRQELLSPAQCAQLLALPTDPRQIAERYTFTPADLDLIAKCRGGPNRLGFAVQLGLLRYPGRAWTPLESVPLPLLQFIAAQVGVSPGRLTEYGTRDETRREHLAKLLTTFGWRTFGVREHREASTWLMKLARSTDQGLVLVRELMDETPRTTYYGPQSIGARPPGSRSASSCPPRGVPSADCGSHYR